MIKMSTSDWEAYQNLMDQVVDLKLNYEVTKKAHDMLVKENEFLKNIIEKFEIIGNRHMNPELLEGE